MIVNFAIYNFAYYVVNINLYNKNDFLQKR